MGIIYKEESLIKNNYIKIKIRDAQKIFGPKILFVYFYYLRFIALIL